ncbi:rRNA maturation RNase YbeY [Clostridium rectalis]|uniref:rRNA maturation RNase YbeY n=1 Tax=Clostridium rectalis TaxID=2040295 RepID=UPI000F635472|nr:rRNA maturation RNase YbeY [Clostridium rectalis]
MIYIDNRQGKIIIDESFEQSIENIINYVLKIEEVEIDYEVSLIFVDNESIKKINRDNRGIDKVTDVLSFPMLNYPEGKVFKEVYKGYEFKDEDLDENRLVLGDIVLSLERSKEQSVEYGHSFLRESFYLTVHSVLHLLGYDHMKDEDKNLMRRREEEIMDKFNLKR